MTSFLPEPAVSMPPGMSATATHNLIIADRSGDGIFAVATILDVCPAANACIRAWHNSTDRFILFTLERKDDRIGSVTARGLEHLLEEVLPELCLDLRKPLAKVAFSILVDASDVGPIEDRIAQLLIAAALEAGLPH
jgi:hypothetical protein